MRGSPPALPAAERGRSDARMRRVGAAARRPGCRRHEAPRDDLAERRRDGMRGERRDAEEAERLAAALDRRQLDGERRRRHERRGEAHALHDAQQEQQRPHARHGDVGERGERHGERARGDEAAPPDAVEQRAEERQDAEPREAGRPHDVADRPLGDAELLQMQRQEEERGEVEEEDEVRGGDQVEIAGETAAGHRKGLIDARRPRNAAPPPARCRDRDALPVP